VSLFIDCFSFILDNFSFAIGYLSFLLGNTSHGNVNVKLIYDDTYVIEKVSKFVGYESNNRFE